ncbi:MAG: DUF3108 domain-containing protein, partial [Bacteroidota bacterium]
MSRCSTSQTLLRWAKTYLWLLIPILILAFKSPRLDNEPFQRGEYLKFRFHYGLFNAGYASLQITDDTVYQGKPCYHVVGKGWSNSTWDLIYKIRDRYESWIDQESLTPRKFERRIQEGKFSMYQKVLFAQKSGKAYYYDPGRGKQTYEVPEDIQDVLS